MPHSSSIAAQTYEARTTEEGRELARLSADIVIASAVAGVTTRHPHRSWGIDHRILLADLRRSHREATAALTAVDG